MWLSKMFLIIYKNNGSGLAELKGELRMGEGRVIFLKAFVPFWG